MTVLDRLQSIFPTERRSLALIAAELRILRRMAEIWFQEAGLPLPVTEKEAAKASVAAAKLDDESPVPTEDQLIDQWLTRTLQKRQQGIDDEDTRRLDEILFLG